MIDLIRGFFRRRRFKRAYPTWRHFNSPLAIINLLGGLSAIHSMDYDYENPAVADTLKVLDKLTVRLTKRYGKGWWK